MEEFLRKIYQKFLDFDQYYFLKDVPTWFGVEKAKLNKKILKEFYENYQKPSFLSFLKNVKDIIYSPNVFDFITKNALEDWDLWRYLKFLEKEELIKIKGGKQVVVLNKKFLELIPRPQSEKEIKEKIERKLKVKVKENEPIVDLFKKFQNFEVKAKWDQMPVSQGSAIFTAHKILDRLSLNKKFLFIGDDDFLSVVLSLAEPKIESVVIDIDDSLLDSINLLAKKFNLKIETRKTDIRKDKFLGEKFIGFLTNPVYTADGAREFIKYGKNQLSKDGGFVFLEIGDEAIGHRFLFLQEFFAKENLIIKEILANKIYYPYVSLHKEDKVISERLFKIIDKKFVEDSPKLGASLYIFDYIPFPVKKVKFKKSIYSYL